ncbi:unnamed protein product [Paramecium octaurelia]|uniref:Transmembrane protein n=1 Tax=Paramecium octaurelia TaxID=43137 RepID=A0A8S1YE20_PAROT|nr:unnamed protein product [Paramecium octaurelia]
MILKSIQKAQNQNKLGYQAKLIQLIFLILIVFQCYGITIYYEKKCSNSIINFFLKIKTKPLITLLIFTKDFNIITNTEQQ